MQTSEEKIHLLLVEDNPGDVQLIKLVLSEVHPDVEVMTAADGDEGLAYIQRCLRESPTKLPQLILLDLNLPKRSGGEILEVVKGNPHLSHIPVIVLTSSNAVKDILASYRMHANAYIVKPMELNELYRIAKSLGDFWLRSCRLPWYETGPLPIGGIVNDPDYCAQQ